MTNKDKDQVLIPMVTTIEAALDYGYSMKDIRLWRIGNRMCTVILVPGTKEQYDICKKAGLMRYEVNGKSALIRKIDLHYIDEFGRTNLQRMQQGLAALDPKTGKQYQLHHIGQEMNSTLAILTEAEHKQGGNNLIWHIFDGASKIDRTAFQSQREKFWKAMSTILLKGGL